MSIAHRVSSLTSLLRHTANPGLHRPIYADHISRALDDNKNLDSTPWAGLFLHADDLAAPRTTAAVPPRGN